MSYDAEESSAFRGKPVELFHFRTDDNIENWCFTTGDEQESDGLLTYVVAPIRRNGLSSSVGESQRQMTIEFPRDDPLAKLFVGYLPARKINLIVYRKHIGDLLAEKRPVFLGTVNSISFDDEKGIISCHPLTNGALRTVPWPCYKSQCIWAVYNAGCGVLKSAHQLMLPSGPNSVSGVVITDPDFALVPDGWYTNGVMEVVSTREQRFVVEHIGDTIRIDSPFRNSPAGEQSIVLPGCDRTEPTCRTKFNNIANYMGFNRVPTENPFDTSFSGNTSSAGGNRRRGVSYRGGSVPTTGG